MHQMLFLGWGEGLALCELEATQKCKSAPRLLSMIVVWFLKFSLSPSSKLFMNYGQNQRQKKLRINIG